MRIPTPDTVTDAATKGYLLRLVKYLTDQFSTQPAVNTAAASVILASPNGSVYSVKVTDAGVLETELMFSP